MFGTYVGGCVDGVDIVVDSSVGAALFDCVVGIGVVTVACCFGV